jgi:hypothetical protein
MRPCFRDPTTPPPTDPEAAWAKNPPSSLSQPTPSSRPDARSTALTPCLKTRFRVMTSSDDWILLLPRALGRAPSTRTSENGASINNVKSATLRF